MSNFINITSRPTIGSIRMYAQAPTVSTQSTWAIFFDLALIKPIEKAIFLDEESLRKKAITQNYPYPSLSSFDKANSLLREISKKQATIEFINPSEDGGVTIEFFYKDLYHMLDVSNDEEVHLLVRRSPNTTIDNISHGYVDAFVREIG